MAVAKTHPQEPRCDELFPRSLISDATTKKDLSALLQTGSDLSIGSLVSGIGMRSFTVSIATGDMAAAMPNNPKSPFVVTLEWLILLAALSQVCVLVCSVLAPDWFTRHDESMFHVSDWALNSPPIFGVLVNLYAFAEMLSKGVNSIDADFLRFFGEAAVTTIIGGMVYVINLGLKIFIRFDRA